MLNGKCCLASVLKKKIVIFDLIELLVNLTLKCTRKLSPRDLHDLEMFSGSLAYAPIMLFLKLDKNVDYLRG